MPVYMWVSVLAFLAGGLLVLYGGLPATSYQAPQSDPPCWHLQMLDGNAYRMNECTGAFERVDWF